MKPGCIVRVEQRIWPRGNDEIDYGIIYSVRQPCYAFVQGKLSCVVSCVVGKGDGPDRDSYSFAADCVRSNKGVFIVRYK